MERQQESLKSGKKFFKIICLGPKISYSIYADIFALLFNLLTWFFGILITTNSVFIFLTVLSYIFCFYLEFCSTVSIYLSSFDNKNIKKILVDLYKKNPYISIHGKSFHFRESNRSDEIVTTYQRSIRFNYLYCRDISEINNLNINEKTYKNTYYIFLKVIYEIYCDDSETMIEYNNLKDRLLNLIKTKDVKYELVEYINRKDESYITFANLKQKEFVIIGIGWFIFFTLIGLSTLYKIYINIISIYRTVTIKKLISRKNNIEIDETLNKYNPKLIIFNNTIIINKNNIIIENNNERIEFPNNENILHNSEQNINIEEREFPVNIQEEYNNKNDNNNDQENHINNINNQHIEQKSTSAIRGTDISSKK